MLVRDPSGRWVPGPRLAELARSAPDPLLAAAGPVLARLRDRSGESAQLYRRDGDERVCVAAAERTSGLRDDGGGRRPADDDAPAPAAQVLAAWSEDDLPPGARFGQRALAEVRRRGWAYSVASARRASRRCRRRCSTTPATSPRRSRCPVRWSG